jgi:steroid delta-isomerase-like uncharacterized protein
MPAADLDRRRAARLATVEEHVRLENAHDIDGIMTTFGMKARYDDEPWDDHCVGRDSVRAYYADLLRAVPDLCIDVQQRHVTDTDVILEVIIRGHHMGVWRGLPATGRELAVPLCGVFTFDDNDRLAGERIYYDRASVLRQLGVFHEPDRIVGRIETVLMHPLTIARAIGRMMRR